MGLTDVHAEDCEIGLFVIFGMILSKKDSKTFHKCYIMSIKINLKKQFTQKCKFAPNFPIKQSNSILIGIQHQFLQFNPGLELISAGKKQPINVISY